MNEDNKQIIHLKYVILLCHYDDWSLNKLSTMLCSRLLKYFTGDKIYNLSQFQALAYVQILINMI